MSPTRSAAIDAVREAALPAPGAAALEKAPPVTADSGSVPARHDAAPHAHHYLIPAPDTGPPLGVCRLCGHTKMHSNVFEYDDADGGLLGWLGSTRWPRHGRMADLDFMFAAAGDTAATEDGFLDDELPDANDALVLDATASAAWPPDGECTEPEDLAGRPRRKRGSRSGARGPRAR